MKTVKKLTLWIVAIGIAFLIANFTELKAQDTCQYGSVLSYQKVSDAEGNFTGTLNNLSSFGQSMASMGDLDGDGIIDLAVGAPMDNDGGTGRGAVWILFMNSDGTVKSHQKISDTAGNFTGILNNGDYFGDAVTSIGDLDNDGVMDLAVGAFHDGDGGSWNGAVWILFMNSNGTVKSNQKISDTQGNFTGTFTSTCAFGSAIDTLGDLDGDGVIDIVVGAYRDNSAVGAVWILFLNSNGTVKTYQKVNSTEGNFTGILDVNDYFGVSVANMGDINEDGYLEIAVGANLDDDGGADKGAVWILTLNTNGTVKSYKKISDTQGNFTSILSDSELFASGMGNIGDVDGNGVADLLVGAPYYPNSSFGKAYLLFLDTTGSVIDYKVIDTTSLPIEFGDDFGCSVSLIGDMNNDGYNEIAISSRKNDDGGTDRGAIYILSLCGNNIGYTLSGTVYADSSITCDGTVILYYQDGANWIPQNYYITDEDCTDSITAYNYRFTDLVPGNYIVYAIPGLDNTADYYATYYVHKLNFNDAYTIPLSSDIANVDINLIPKNTSLEEAGDIVDMVNLYPNPVSDNLNIEFNLKADAKVDLWIVNNIGQVVYNKTSDNNTGANKLSVYTDNLNSGMYFVNMNVNNKVIHFKFIKQ